MKTFIDFKKELDNDPELRFRYLEILDRMAYDNDGDITPEMSAEAAEELGFEAAPSMFEMICVQNDSELSSDELAGAGGGLSYSDLIRQWINGKM